MSDEDDEIKFVVGIDFGTTYSGYAFSLSCDELTFYSPQVWNSGHGGMTSLRTPTSLLLNPDQTFHSFGFEAEDKFADLAASDEHHGFYFFRRFKMELHSKNIKRKSNIDDITGKPVPAIKIFSLSIRYIKDHCLKTISDRGFLTSPKDIKFVLTVPAIWNDRSKQFMKEAAIQAGIDKTQLTLALEPEAASIYCQRESLEKLRINQDQSKLTNPKTRYLVADIGGGTADFSVHEVEDGGTLTELYRASGGPYGGIYVDQEYLNIYDTIFGEGSIDQLKSEDMEEYLTIVREFETKKRSITSDYALQFSSKLSAFFHEKFSNAVKMEKVQSSYLKDKVSFVKDKLKLSPSLMKSFFKETIDNIVYHVENILEIIQDIEVILLVGGYADSPLVQERFKNKFACCNIIIPQDSNLVVMKGAVLFGHNPMFISARVLRFSYGVALQSRFDPKIHPEDKRYYDENGVERCKDAFDKLIDRNTKVPSTGKTIMTYGNPMYDTQKVYVTELYCTEEDSPVVVDDCCQFVGSLEISVPEYFKGKWEGVEKYVFGMTEISVSAKVKATNQTFETTLDLLE